MKLLRYGPQGSEKPGLMDEKGQIRDLSDVVKDIDPDFFAGDGLRKVAAMDIDQLPIVQGTPRIGACIRRPGNFIAVGLNYVQHAIETNAPIPSEPILFNKAPSCIAGPDDDVVIPLRSQSTDWEVELAVVINQDCSEVSKEEALAFVAGYCICHDLSERDSQINRGGQWVKGKSFKTFGPLGPWLVTPQDAPDIHAARLWLTVNGETMQDGNTNQMIFPVAEIVSYVSQYMLLRAGDVITTGTPKGVGLSRKPPRYLKAGDSVHLGIDGLGIQRQRMVAHPAAGAS